MLPWRAFSQPLDEIRDYYGSSVALYFAWIELYTRALVAPAILGLALTWVMKQHQLVSPAEL
eukprot:COSAG05_NODE_18445_length_308_cov_0.961722_1_plen_61_part_10